MSDPKKPSLADLIAATPGAQPADKARESIKARRAQLLNSSAPSPEDFSEPEPLPFVDADDFAKSFFQRMMDKETPAPGSKPRLVVDNEASPLSDGDDDPEPPKAA